MQRKYEASLDTMATVITVAIVLLLTSIAASVWIFPDAGDKIGVRIFTTVMMVAILVLSYSFAPKAFSFDENAIVIHRFWDNATIPFSKIIGVRKLDKIDRKGLIRTMGNGGLFGYYGDFRNSELGNMDWYLTRRRNVVLVETASAKFLLSPNDVDAFTSELEKSLAKFNKTTT